MTRTRFAGGQLAVSLAAAAVATYLVWLLVEIGPVTDALYRNPDNASSLVLGQFLGDRGSGDVILGNYAWLEPLYALDLTRWLPSHRELWEAGPYLAYAASIALVAVAVGRAVSTTAGLVAGLAMAAPAPLVLGYVAVPNAHAHALLHIAILAAFVVSLPAVSGWPAIGRALWAALLAVSLAAGMSSDVLVAIGGVVPFLAALALGWRRVAIPGALAALGAVGCLAGVGGGLALAAWADDAGIHDTGTSIPLASPGHALHNVWRLLEDAALFVHGRLGDTSGALDLALEAVGLIAVVVLPVLFVWILVRAVPVLAGRDVPSAERRLLTAYWATAAVALSVAFVLSSAPVDIGSVRYLTSLWPALVSLVLLVFGARAVNAVAAVAAVAAALGCAELAAGRYTTGKEAFPAADLRGLQSFVAANRLDHGYASYVNAPVVTAGTDFRIRAYPVGRCAPTGDALCRYGIHRIDSWYAPRPGTRSFFLAAERPGWPRLGGPPARWGPPVAERQFGPFRIYAYDYDLAFALASGGPPGQDRAATARR